MAAVLGNRAVPAEEAKAGPATQAPPTPHVVRDGASIGRAVVITDMADLVEQREDEFIGAVCGQKLRDWRVYYRRMIGAGGHLYHETTILLSPSFKRRIFYFDVTVPLAPVVLTEEAGETARKEGS